ncbi:MAG: hypothetical protein FJ271_02705 [Planctomycetes bacterium]|nr:hypothetical protein [Planctomycetota bacterium]
MRFFASLSLILVCGAASVRADKVIVVAGADESAATRADIKTPFGMEFDRRGNMYIAEYSGHRVLKMDARGKLAVLAGTGAKGFSGDGGPALKAKFNVMHNLTVAGTGDIYVADTGNRRVRKINGKTGTVTTIAGTGRKGFSGDGGPATEADFGDIYCTALAPAGNLLYLADLDNRRIRVVDLETNIVRTVAGNGKRGVPADGAEATKAPLVDPRAVAVDGKGNVYVLERGGHALRVVNAKGKIRTVAGTGKQGFAGDGGDALKALLNGPKFLYLDAQGNVLIADTENHVIRKYRPADGTIVRVAGSGKRGKGGVGAAPEQVELNQPHGVYVHPSGAIYIADSTNNRILKIEK